MGMDEDEWQYGKAFLLRLPCHGNTKTRAISRKLDRFRNRKKLAYCDAD